MLLHFEPQSGTIGDRFGSTRSGWKGMGAAEMPGVHPGLQDPTIGNLLTPNQASGGDHGSDTAGIEGGAYTTVALYDAWFAQGRLSTIATAEQRRGGSGPNSGYRPGYNQIGKTFHRDRHRQGDHGHPAGLPNGRQLREDGNHTGRSHLHHRRPPSPLPTVTLQHTFTVPPRSADTPSPASWCTSTRRLGRSATRLPPTNWACGRGSAAGDARNPDHRPVRSRHQRRGPPVRHRRPEGVVTAAPGSTFPQTDSPTDVKGWIRWVKATGTGAPGGCRAEADTGERSLDATAFGVDTGS